MIAPANTNPADFSGFGHFGFAHPWVLALLLVPLALAALEFARLRLGRGTPVALPIGKLVGKRVGEPARLTSLQESGKAAHNLSWAVRRCAPLALLCATLLPLAVLSVVVLILAGPRTMGPPRQERVLTNIEFVLDVSGSMSSPMAGGMTRNAASIDAIKYFLEKRKGDAFGLTIFGGDVAKWVPLTKDHKAIASSTAFLDPSKVPAVLQSTMVGKALKFTKQSMLAAAAGATGLANADPSLTGANGEGVSDANADLRAEATDGTGKLIVLITDGFSFDLDGGAAPRLASDLASAGIVVHAVHVGEGQAPAQLTEVVTPTGGRVFSATNPASFSAIFDAIDSMAPVRLRTIEPEPIDHFGPLVRIGGVILALHLLCLFWLRLTPW